MTTKLLSSIFWQNRFFYTVCFFFLVCSGLLLSVMSKGDSFMALNGLHTQWLTFFFRNCTFVGDGNFSILVCLVLFLCKQRKLALCVLLAYLSSGLVAQGLKHLIPAPRPRLFFETNGILFHQEYFKASLSGNNSFPSGHTTSAFALATVLANHYRKPLATGLLFFAAVLVGYSRVYLAEHFPIDVWTAIFIGISFGFLFTAFMRSGSFNFGIFKSKAKASSDDVPAWE